MSVMQLGFATFARSSAATSNILVQNRIMALPSEAAEASKINKPSNGLGKSGLIDLQGFSRHSPKRGQYAPSKSPRALAGTHVRSVSGARRYRTRHARTRSFLPEVATRVCRRPFEPCHPNSSAAPTLTRWRVREAGNHRPRFLMRPWPRKAAWLRPIYRPLDPFGEGVRRRAGLSCVTNPFSTPGLRRRRHVGHPASRSLQRVPLHKNDCAIGFVCP